MKHYREVLCPMKKNSGIATGSLLNALTAGELKINRNPADGTGFLNGLKKCQKKPAIHCAPHVLIIIINRNSSIENVKGPPKPILSIPTGFNPLRKSKPPVINRVWYWSCMAPLIRTACESFSGSSPFQL